MLLKGELSTFKKERFARHSEEIKSTMLTALKRLNQSGIVEGAPNVRMLHSC